MLSFTPPENMLNDVVCGCPVFGVKRDEDASWDESPPRLTVAPLSHPPTLLLDIAVRVQDAFRRSPALVPDLVSFQSQTGHLITVQCARARSWRATIRMSI